MRKGKKISFNSVTEYSEITATGTLTCFLSYFESKILINIGSLESLGSDSERET